MIELTIQQASSNPASFMYIWASKEFLKAINAKYAKIIYGKQLNQIKLLTLSAEKFGKTYDEYVAEIRKAFIDTYGMSPEKALLILAQGGSVAGKNWEQGVFGIGALSNKFAGTDITVDPKTGYMMRDGKYLPVYDTVYTEIKGKTVAYQLFYYEEDTKRTYMSQYNKTMKKYYAKSYSTPEAKYSASGTQINASDGADIWGNIKLDTEWFKQIISWILSIFGISVKTGMETETINATNTLPDQATDGFITEAGMGEAAGLLLALVAGGTLLAGGLKKKK